VALAPNLFSRWKGDEQALRAGRERVVLPDPEVAAVIDAALDFLKVHPRVSSARVALMGVCQSGRYPVVVGSGGAISRLSWCSTAPRSSAIGRYPGCSPSRCRR